MTRSTEFRNAGSRFGSTIRQSLDMITGRNVSNYTLLFLDPTKQHKKGESKNIVVPYIVLGRNSSCHVQYGDDFPTVSRQHASIQSDDKGCTLIHNPQATNPTYVDGKQIAEYYNLETGDEIQLSQDGPRIRFLMDKNMKTSTIGFTRRMSMAIGQSLRPYKQALMVAGLLLLGVIGYSVWSTIKVSDMEAEQGKLTSDIEDTKATISSQFDSIQSLKQQTQKHEVEIKQTQSQIQSSLNARRNLSTMLINSESSGEKSSVAVSKILHGLEENIYYIHVLNFELGNKLNVIDEENPIVRRWSGTGFLSTDGRFYTARHVVEPWYYPDSSCGDLARINDLISGGTSVFVKYLAVSSSGDSFEFTNKDIIDDSSRDIVVEYECEGDEIRANVPSAGDWQTDYAYINIGNRSSNISYDRSLSRNLERGETLYILGYPLGLHLQDDYTLSPVYSEAKVAQNGLKNGLLHVTSESFAGGNSGGPVFAIRHNKLVVVGIVSGGYGKVGVIVPTANFR